MNGKKKGTPAFDAQCWRLRFDEQMTLKEIALATQASTNTVRRALRRHATTEGLEIPDERFGTRIQWHKDVALAARRLANGEAPEQVLKATSYRNVCSMLVAVRRYRRQTGRKRAVISGTASIGIKGGRPSIILCAPAPRAAGWNAGDAIRWHAQGGEATLQRYERTDRPHPVRTNGDTEADAYFYHFTEGLTWKETGEKIGLSATGASSAAIRFANRHPEHKLPRSVRSTQLDSGVIHVTRSHGNLLIHLRLAAMRLGWKPGQTVEWKWDARTRLIRVRLTSS